MSMTHPPPTVCTEYEITFPTPATSSWDSKSSASGSVFVTEYESPVTAYVCAAAGPTTATILRTVASKPTPTRRYPPIATPLARGIEGTTLKDLRRDGLDRI